MGGYRGALRAQKFVVFRCIFSLYLWSWVNDTSFPGSDQSKRELNSSRWNLFDGENCETGIATRQGSYLFAADTISDLQKYFDPSSDLPKPQKFSSDCWSNCCSGVLWSGNIKIISTSWSRMLIGISFCNVLISSTHVYFVSWKLSLNLNSQNCLHLTPRLIFLKKEIGSRVSMFILLRSHQLNCHNIPISISIGIYQQWILVVVLPDYLSTGM